MTVENRSLLCCGIILGFSKRLFTTTGNEVPIRAVFQLTQHTLAHGQVTDEFILCKEE